MLLKKGMYNNSDVKNMQHELRTIGYTIDVDGDFGKGTEQFVCSFQYSNHLTVDGMAGDNTLTTLKTMYDTVVGSDLYEDDLVGEKVLVNTEIPHHYESCKLDAYLCPAGVWTIGWGSTGAHVYKGLSITKHAADCLFIEDCKRFIDTVNTKVTVPLNQHQFDSLVSFTYNIGVGNFNSSTLLKKLNQGDYLSAAQEMLRWNKGGGKVLKGLAYRRESEKLYFETGELKFFN